MRNTKSLPCGIPPSAGPRSGIQQGEHETNPKSKFSNVQNVTGYKYLFFVLVMRVLEIRICFGFRYSDFGFEPAL